MIIRKTCKCPGTICRHTQLQEAAQILQDIAERRKQRDRAAYDHKKEQASALQEEMRLLREEARERDRQQTEQDREAREQARKKAEQERQAELEEKARRRAQEQERKLKERIKRDAEEIKRRAEEKEARKQRRERQKEEAALYVQIHYAMDLIDEYVCNQTFKLSERFRLLHEEIQRLVELQRLKQSEEIEQQRLYVLSVLTSGKRFSVQTKEGWCCICWKCKNVICLPFEPQRSKLCEVCELVRPLMPHQLKKYPPGDHLNSFENVVRAYEETWT